MSNLPRNLYTATQVRELDRQAIEEQGIAGLELMEKAGEAACEIFTKIWFNAWRVVVVCGVGNNGGDGYVIARLAQQLDKNVVLLQVGDHRNLSGDVKACAEKLLEVGVKPEIFSIDKLEQADVIIDAMLGTGLDRDVSGDYLSAISAINNAAAPVFAVDVPSGLDADTGRVMGGAIEAHSTVSFIGLKQGLLTGEGPTHSGHVYFNDLDVPDAIYNAVPVSSCRIDSNSQKKYLPRRKSAAHKGRYGHVLIVGGDKGFAGAARMASEAAGRTGSGLVSLATRQQHAVQIAMTRPEIMVHAVEKSNQLDSLIERASVIAIGPGLGQRGWGQKMLSAILKTSLPLVIDADALNLIAEQPSKRDNWILTPHPVEAARLLNCLVDDILLDRFAAVTELQKQYGGVVILKGAGTLITTEAECISLCDQGNPGMATGGMGDVLTGIVASLIAQGCGLKVAAETAVCIHANAGDLAAVNGQRGMLAMDLMPEIRTLVNP